MVNKFGVYPKSCWRKALIGAADLLGFGLSQKITGWFQPVNRAACEGVATPSTRRPREALLTVSR